MNDSSNGIFTFQQLNTIRDAHRDWCAENSIDHASPVGQESAAMMLEAFKAGNITREGLTAACDEYVRQRQENVRLGSPAVESRS